jgi:hypothetical protein
MSKTSFCVLPAVLATLALAGSAAAQLPLPTGGGARINTDSRTPQKLKIPRKTVSGLVKAVDVEKKLFTLTAKNSGKELELPIDVGPSLIKAGKGSATMADIQSGDKVRVWGEVTAQGGIRAMEITLPKERMSIPPPQKPKRVKVKKEKTEKAAPAEKAEKAEQGAEKKEGAETPAPAAEIPASVPEKQEEPKPSSGQ